MIWYQYLRKNSDVARYCFYILWIISTALQAFHTQLIPDEAYYWTWSQQLAWGYFDHPPVIAFAIRLGYFVCKSELGVRLVTISGSTATIYLIEKMVNPQNLLLFYSSVLSVAMVHFLGFIAVPDSPLLLLTTTYFLLYRSYLAKEKAATILLLAANIALLVLCKYYSALIVICTIASCPPLLRRKSVYIIAALSLLLITPHIIWQVQHGAPSITFQLFERAHERYSISLTLECIAYVLLAFGPVTGTLLFYQALRCPPAGLFEKALQYTLVGTLIFFVAMSFKGKVEANWISFLFSPIVILGYNKVAGSQRFQQMLKYTFPPTLVLIIIARVFIAHNFLPESLRFPTDFHGHKEWAEKIKSVAADRRVAFMNSYQNAAEYQFYTGKSAFSLNNFRGRKDQYTVWKAESAAQGQEVAVIPNFNYGWLPSIPTPRGDYQYWNISNFRSSSDITVQLPRRKLHARTSVPFSVSFTLHRHQQCNVDVEANSCFPAQLGYQFVLAKNIEKDTTTSFRITNDMLTGYKTYSVTIDPPSKPGTYSLYFSVAAGLLPPTTNSTPLTVVVE